MLELNPGVMCQSSALTPRPYCSMQYAIKLFANWGGVTPQTNKSQLNLPPIIPSAFVN